jgi:hypothetical protein
MKQSRERQTIIDHLVAAFTRLDDSSQAYIEDLTSQLLTIHTESPENKGKGPCGKNPETVPNCKRG